tara:strand:- start:28 stop:519 length:492 start_codon:yes stop_codon:yes gene_type:complete
MAAAIAPLLCIAGALQIVSTLLASAVEALGRFAWVWLTQAVLIALQVAVVLVLIRFPSIWTVVVALIVTNVVRHAAHIWLCARAGYVSVVRLLRAYGLVVLASIAVAALTWLVLYLFRAAIEQSWAWSIAAIAVLGLCSAVLWLFRDKLPPVVLARRYGILPS